MKGKAWKRGKVVEVLEPYLRLSYSLRKACSVAGIPRTTVQTWVDTDETLRLKITAWQNEINAQARRNIVEKIQGGDTETAKWWLERREKEDFSLRSELTGAKGEPIVRIDAGKDPYKTPEGRKLLLDNE